MRTIVIKNNQCFLDIVLESTGSIDNALQMAVSNDTSITDERAIGTPYIVSGTVHKSVVDVMRVYTPATALRDYSEKTNYRLPGIFPIF